MQKSQEIDVRLGQEIQVSVNPVIQTTSNIARSRFSPEDRGCYFEVKNDNTGFTFT